MLSHSIVQLPCDYYLLLSFYLFIYLCVCVCVYFIYKLMQFIMSPFLYKMDSEL